MIEISLFFFAYFSLLALNAATTMVLSRKPDDTRVRSVVVNSLFAGLIVYISSEFTSDQVQRSLVLAVSSLIPLSVMGYDLEGNYLVRFVTSAAVASSTFFLSKK